jgi:NAD(P)-dependent dehydrogenase (short-subunit alcohol dehydrogenase family)
MRTLIIGSSGGIGAALLAASGPNAIGLSRSQHGLDITDEASIAAHLGAQEAPFDRIIIATGALELNGARPEKSLRALDAAAMSAQFQLNAIGPALVLKHALRLIPRDRPAQIAALSARVGSIGDNALGGWHSYRAAKAALNQFFHTAAIEIARTHPMACVAIIHPGTVATSLGATYSGNHPTTPPDQAAKNILHVLQGLTPENTGQFFDWQGKVIPW